MIRYLSLFLALLLPLHAATKHVAQTAAGANDGSSAANAYSVAQLNAGSPYSPAAGDTVVLNGAISSQIVPPSSGSSGNPITYLFASGAYMSAPVWPTQQGAIQFGTRNYITVDGGATGTIGKGGSGTPNGYIRTTDNGVGMTYQNSCGGVVGTGGSNCIVKNLVIGPLFVRTGTTDQNQPCVGVENLASSAEITNFTVMNCVIHDAFFGISVEGGNSSSGFQLHTNEIYNCNHGISLATRNSSGNNITGSAIYNNWVHAWTIWNDTTPPNSHHHNGIFLKADSGLIDGVDIYANKFGPGFGGSYQTGAIFGNTGMKNIRIYSNVFVAGSGEYSGNAMIVLQSTNASTFGIDNNTFINDAGRSIEISGSNALIPASAVAQTWNVRNNLGSTSNGYGFIAVHYSPGITLNANNNFGYGYTFTSNPYDFSSTGSGNTMTFAAWQALGYDAAGGYGVDPQIHATTYVPAAVAVGTGANLSGSFTTDYNGATRSTWDGGAVNASGATTPTLSSAAINTAGTTLTLTLSESCTTGGGGSGGVTISATGGASTATYSSGSGSTAYVYSLSRTIAAGETVTVSYTQPGSGIESTDDQTDLATFSSQAVTNNSTYVVITPARTRRGASPSIIPGF